MIVVPSSSLASVVTPPVVAASQFANAFDIDFRARTCGLSSYEIPLFRKLCESLRALSGRFQIEEYHGTGHQVRFVGNGTNARVQARCELSDLMVITFCKYSGQIRLTYIQAKSEKAILPSVCGYPFKANLEQWYLLSSRPAIKGIGLFNPPSHLLSAAVLSSVGSYLFFYQDSNLDFQCYYASASYLAIVGSRAGRSGRLCAKSACGVRSHGGHTECVGACGNVRFADALFRGHIGTPIDSSVQGSGATRNWLASILRSVSKDTPSSDRRGPLAQELAFLLAADQVRDSAGSFGARSMIIIKSNFGERTS
jgi:hypothetical protein